MFLLVDKKDIFCEFHDAFRSGNLGILTAILRRKKGGVCGRRSLIKGNSPKREQVPHPGHYFADSAYFFGVSWLFAFSQEHQAVSRAQPTTRTLKERRLRAHFVGLAMLGYLYYGWLLFQTVMSGPC